MNKTKPKTCKNCGSPFDPFRPLQNVCTITCSIELAQKKAKAKEDKEWKLRKKIGLLKLKTLGEFEAEAREVFQKWVRLRDKDLPCISCGKIQDDCWQGSHYLKAELFSGLIFDERNCHKSCLKCNFFLDGNELGYRDGLVKRYGEQYVKGLESEKESSRVRKYTREGYLVIKATYKKKIKELGLNRV